MSEGRASALRALIRASLITATVFGLKLTPEQIGAIQLLAEAALQAHRKFFGKGQ